MKIGRLIITTKSVIDKDAQILIMHCRQKFLQIGREIERVHMLRELKGRLSEPKWRELASLYDYDKLDAEYPHNPLLENPHGKAKTTPQGFNL